MIHLSAFADEISADPVEQLDTLIDLGVFNVEFRSIHGTNVLDLSREQHEQFKALLSERGMGLSAIGSPVGKVLINEPQDPDLDRLQKAFELCTFYNCPRIRVFAFYMPDGGDPNSHRDEVIQRMRRMVELAAERKVTLMLENEKKTFGDTAERVKAIFDAINSPALRHAFDPANYLEIGQAIDPAWTMLKSKVGHFHVKDYNVKQKKNVIVGEGDGHIPRLIAEAVALGFDGYCVLEPHLVVAEQSYGFTGPERFGDATVALQTALSREGVTYD